MPAFSSTSGDRSQLWILGPRPEPFEGVSTVRVNFPVFFKIVRRVGPDAALLLLTIRALRQRAPVEVPRASELAWMLVATRGEVLGWLGRLARARLVVVDERGGADVVIEVVAEPPNPAEWQVESIALVMPTQTLPTHWFVQVLPRLGRARFLLYLYLLSREGAPEGNAALVLKDAARAVGIRRQFVVQYHLGRLGRFGVVRPTRSGRGLIVLDPPPITSGGRFHLQLLRWGYRPLPWRRMVIASLVIAFILLVLGYLVTHPLDVLPPTPVRDDEQSYPVRLAGVLPRA